jgi:hypothetical protein
MRHVKGLRMHQRINVWSAILACWFALISSTAIAQIPSMYPAPTSGATSLVEINRLISAGKCGDAEATARLSVRPPLLHTILGLVELDCRKNRQAAVNLLALAAVERESVAIETLNSLGIPVPPPSRLADPRAWGSEPDPILPPPPHTMSPLPQPKTRVIVLPPPVIVVPSVNPNACIQDGGNVFCRR